MKPLKYIYLATFLGIILVSCSPKLDKEVTLTNNNVDFSKYVSFGNSLTAGYADGGLYLEGQQNSYPSIIAGQLKLVGGGDFVQPLFTDAQLNGSGYIKLTGFDATGSPVTAKVTDKTAIRGIAPTGGYLYTKYSGEVNNLGVPGIRISDIVTAGYGSVMGNPFFERILTDAEALKTYQQKAIESKPTFFSCWLGNNDILGYATSGGITPITPSATFQTLYANFITAVLASNTGVKGVLAAIPNVTSIPYFNTVTLPVIRAKVKGTPLQDAPLYVRTGTGEVRVFATGDLIVLTADSIGTIGNVNLGGNIVQIPKGFSQYYPLNNEDVLDKDEVTISVSTVTSYNDIIKNIATDKGLAFFDAYNYLNDFKTGKEVDAVSLSTAYISGGIFSLDGVHLTPRGYALTANEFIKAINSKYGSLIPTTDITQYRGVKFP